ncbi:hypothetical protein B425_1247 [Bacillus amyloliquefaciens]|nr:hypothetical protein LL3_01343 [Bacillus amyloliquefaciens LL3]KYC97945.1 hypothetical protein B425_1247 [Bacillus amyloliquefaciens]
MRKKSPDRTLNQFPFLLKINIQLLYRLNFNRFKGKERIIYVLACGFSLFLLNN